MPQENQQEILEQMVSWFRSALELGAKSHPQFLSEFPRQVKFEYDLLGLSEDEDHDCKLTLYPDSGAIELISEPVTEIKTTEGVTYPSFVGYTFSLR